MGLISAAGTPAAPHGVGGNIDLPRVRFKRSPGVASLHDLHIWPMSTTEVALTCHLVTPGGHPGDAFLHETAEELRQRFGVHHPTLQIETDPAVACALAPETVV